MAKIRQALGWSFVCALAWAATSAHAVEIDVLSVHPSQGQTANAIRGIDHYSQASINVQFEHVEWWVGTNLLYTDYGNGSSTTSYLTYDFEQWGSMYGVDLWLRVRAYDWDGSNDGGGYWLTVWANLAKKVTTTETVVDELEYGEPYDFSLVLSVPNTNYEFLGGTVTLDGLDGSPTWTGIVGAGGQTLTFPVQGLSAPTPQQLRNALAALKKVVAIAQFLWKIKEALEGDEHEAEIPVREKDPFGGLTGNLKCLQDSDPLDTGPAGSGYVNACEVRYDAYTLYGSLFLSKTDTTNGSGWWSFPGAPTGKTFRLWYAVGDASNYHQHDSDAYTSQKLYHVFEDSTGPLSTKSGPPGAVTPETRELGTVLLSPYN